MHRKGAATRLPLLKSSSRRGIAAGRTEAPGNTPLGSGPKGKPEGNPGAAAGLAWPGMTRAVRSAACPPGSGAHVGVRLSAVYFERN